MFTNKKKKKKLLLNITFMNISDYHKPQNHANILKVIIIIDNAYNIGETVNFLIIVQA